MDGTGDPRSTLEAAIPVGRTRRQDRDPNRSWIKCMVIPGSGKRRVRPQASSYMAWPISRCEKVGEFAVRIEVVGTEYRLFPVVHVSQLKLVKNFRDRPQIQLNPGVTNRLDFDEALLLEDSGSRIGAKTSSN
ncbi:unnamed protein product [Phytophthora fragariaefolia]|uniref:Unnamed protein product n=1 Tax=Phytophthora fragariaefolia TaxID=1490495 RepID=A0A9W6X4L2_9STRA|nr:unnamed protein product [Phytophthora fragariaefolia]